MARPRGYDLDEAIARSATLFRARGYRDVSVQDIVEATGLNRCALYDNFGGKEGLFYAALEHYVDVPVQRLLAPLTSGEPSFDTLLALLEKMRGESLRPDVPAGCLVINASLELGGKDSRVEQVVDRFSSSMRNAFLRALDGACARGELARGRSPAERAEHLVTMVNAFMVLAHVSRASADRFLLAVIDDVRSWRDARHERVAS